MADATKKGFISRIITGIANFFRFIRDFIKRVAARIWRIALILMLAHVFVRPLDALTGEFIYNLISRVCTWSLITSSWMLTMLMTRSLHILIALLALRKIYYGIDRRWLSRRESLARFRAAADGFIRICAFVIRMIYTVPFWILLVFLVTLLYLKFGWLLLGVSVVVSFAYTARINPLGMSETALKRARTVYAAAVVVWLAVALWTAVAEKRLSFPESVDHAPGMIILVVAASVVIARIRTKKWNFAGSILAWSALAGALISLMAIWNGAQEPRLEYRFLRNKCGDIRQQAFVSPLTEIKSHYALQSSVDLARVFITRLECRCVYVASMGGDKPIVKVDVPGTPNYMAGDEKLGRVFVQLGDAGSKGEIDILSINMDDLQTTHRLELPYKFYGLSYAPGRRKLYMCSINTPILYEIDIETFKVLRSRRLPRGMSFMYAILVDEEKNRLYLSDFALLGRFYAVDLDTFEVIKTIKLKTSLSPIAISKSRNLVYVAEFFGKKIVEIDRDTLEVAGTIDAGFTIRSLAVDEKRGYLYSAPMLDNMMLVSDLKTGARVAEIPIGANVRTIHISSDSRVFFSSTCGVYELDVEAALKQLSGKKQD